MYRSFAINNPFIRNYKVFNLHPIEDQLKIYKSFKSISKSAHFYLDFTTS